MRLFNACMSLVTLAMLSGCAENMPTETDDQFADQTNDALITENSLTENSITENSLTENSLTENSLTENSLTENSLTENALSAIQDPSEQGHLNRELLRYIVACAFKPSQSFNFSWTDDGNVTHSERYVGQLGIAPQWRTGSLNERGQRMVSACLGAKVNFYGVHVTISVRSGESPLRLSPFSDELDDYSKVEGAFWGNLWAPTPYFNACYNSHNVDNSRDHQRECAAGHLNSDGTKSACGIIKLAGSCRNVCKSYNYARGYYEDCLTNPGTSWKRTDYVITTALP